VKFQDANYVAICILDLRDPVSVICMYCIADSSKINVVFQRLKSGFWLWSTNT